MLLSCGNLRRLAMAVALVAGSLLASGCAREATLTAFSLQPGAITPNADGDNDVAKVTYSLRREADVSMYVIDAAGERYYFRQSVRRAAGDYSVDFGGTVDGRMLPDGAYRFAIEAIPVAGGDTATSELPLALSDADTTYPEITGLSTYPATFTPDRDGIADRVTISYELSKEVRRIDLYIEGPDGARYTIPDDKLHLPGAAGYHEHDYDAGIDLGAEPPLPGDYTVKLLVEDAVGNRATAEAPLHIDEGGVPRATIVKSGNGAGVAWSAESVPLRGVLYFTLTVQNIGTVPIRTHGPEPGTIYDISSNYSAIGDYLSSGSFRIGVDFEGNTAGHRYPYRWQIGKTEELTKVVYQGQEFYYLMPGQTVEVTGGVRIDEAPHLRTPHFWVGLIHEDVAFVPNEDYVNPTAISIGY
ncbi:MAG: hypothetical protein ACYC5O_23650 [Anaerolineae bacterium]